ncbi:MAG: hypothetical protein ACTS4Y_00490 [Candidatus Hodgkinia cicadicola]
MLFENDVSEFARRSLKQAAFITRLAIMDHAAQLTTGRNLISLYFTLQTWNRTIKMKNIIAEVNYPEDDGPEERSIHLSLFSRHLAYALARSSGIDIFERTMYVDGTFKVVRSAITKGGIIFTDAQSFGHILEPNAFKHKTICVSATSASVRKLPSAHSTTF